MVQLLYMVGTAFLIAYSALGIIRGVMDVDLDISTMGLFLTMISLAVMLLVNGAVNLLGRRGLAIPVLLFIFGMALINILYEFLTGWWQTLIASWEPLRYFGEGTREVAYENMGLWNSASIAVIVVAAVGVILSIISIVWTKPDKNR